MANVKAGELIEKVLRKIGVEDTATYKEVIAKANELEIEEEIDGSIEQGLSALYTESEILANKNLLTNIKAQVKAEVFNGFENKTLKPIVDTLDDFAKAQYARLPNATEKAKFLIDFKSKQSNNDKDLEALRAKLLEYEEGVANGEYVPKTAIQELQNKIIGMKKDVFHKSLLSELKPKVISEFADDDLLLTKAEKAMKNKGLKYDFETGKFVYAEGHEKAGQTATKDKSVREFETTDFVNLFFTENQNLIKKADVTPHASTVNVLSPLVHQGTLPMSDAERYRAKVRESAGV